MSHPSTFSGHFRLKFALQSLVLALIAQYRVFKNAMSTTRERITEAAFDPRVLTHAPNGTLVTIFAPSHMAPLARMRRAQV